MKKLCITIVLIIMLTIPITALADGFGMDHYRCGCHLISIGDTIVDVLKECGEPDVRSTEYLDEAVYLKWTYIEAGKFITTLIFLGDELKRIRTSRVRGGF